ncbi:hypothetical protein CY34DRAFT_12340 [Suillus luteus UH-Slu-Lm8-n1]|uniref:Uncharacterized protein n=1 Tax=Suillus luteus UH-Slu-Lm8-n1 TaxID=930992 RepID=A0A0D0BH60_9AGAM|nr:hypothetical protein CY34DRAFT_12340 [Suillus luteus UH-Slu-Lm8-n1]
MSTMGDIFNDVALKSLEDHAKGTGIHTDINSSTAARKLLTTHGLTLLAAGNVFKEITSALYELSLTPNTDATQTEILRAIAILLHEASQTSNIEQVLNKIEAMVKGPIVTLEANINTLSDLTTMHKAAFEGTTTEVRDQVNLTSKGIEKAVVVAIQKSNQQQANSPAALRGSDGQSTYVEAAKAGMPTQLTRILAQSEAQTRQILIDRRFILSPNSLKDLMEAQLVSKAAMALELMEQQNIEYPKELLFISVRRLPHGGSDFLEFYRTNIIIKDRSYHILMENAPVSFIPDNPTAIADIEKKAGLPPRSIIKTRYIKPVARRNLNQHTAHVAVMFATKEGANQAIKFGLSIARKKEKGHTSWSRECPIFTQKWESHKRRNDKAKYIYFPTEDPLTGEPVPNAHTDQTNAPAPNLTDHYQTPEREIPTTPAQPPRMAHSWKLQMTESTMQQPLKPEQHPTRPQNPNPNPSHRHVDKSTPA